MTIDLNGWAQRWGIPHRAMVELQEITIPDVPIDADGGSETRVQSEIRLAASRAGVVLLRNNSGAAFTRDGRPIRFGLGNDSARANDVMKSSDLIGFTPTGRFLAIEVKPPGWRFTGTGREIAQQNFLQLVIRHGGAGTFATCWDDVHGIL